MIQNKENFRYRSNNWWSLFKLMVPHLEIIRKLVFGQSMQTLHPISYFTKEKKLAKRSKTYHNNNNQTERYTRSLRRSWSQARKSGSLSQLASWRMPRTLGRAEYSVRRASRLLDRRSQCATIACGNPAGHTYIVIHWFIR